MISALRRNQIAAALAAHGGSMPLALAYEAASRTEYGLSDDEVARNRAGYATDPITQAALRFAHAALVTRGRLEPSDLRAARRGGASDTDLAELTVLAAQIAGEIIARNARATIAGLTIEHMFDTITAPCRSSASGSRRSGWLSPG
jgi:hypothetical protein